MDEVAFEMTSRAVKLVGPERAGLSFRWVWVEGWSPLGIGLRSCLVHPKAHLGISGLSWLPCLQGRACVAEITRPCSCAPMPVPGMLQTLYVWKSNVQKQSVPAYNTCRQQQ
eukprot:2266933-Amphidinium_carterae.1